MLIGSILLALAITEFVLGLYFIFRYVRQQSTIWYGLFCVGVSIYVGANGLGYLMDSFFIGERMSWVGGMLATTFFLPFSGVFPLARKPFVQQIGWVVWPVVLFVPGLLLTNAFIDDIGIVKYRGGYETAAGELFWFMLLVFAVYWTWSILNLISSRMTSGGIHRTQLNILLCGILTSLVVAIALDIVLPLTTSSKVGFVGSMVTSVWLGATSWIIRRR